MPEYSSPQQRLESLKLTLPPAPKPVGVYKPALIVGQHLYVSGHGPLLPDGTLMRGRVGRDLDADGGKQAARQVGLTMLSTLIATLGGPAFIKGVRGPCGSAAGSSSCLPAASRSTRPISRPGSPQGCSAWGWGRTSSMRKCSRRAALRNSPNAPVGS